ncbi:Protein kinase-like domain [Cordyceps militaris CM01]|uniref:Protein kinase-like domain n=1 Tax=Cordyceps militaris (strain CM01) TaxID=983644 RepID=G3JBQ3_CORMM|nr:Protein kinase-like domain [Cordyceps militaris CM01]EGX93679.1 Protein kinase-like domain [Cordyceps militaris CM01]
MAFIAARTKIPVPRVHCSFTRRNVTYIVMERMRGKTLADAWPSLSDADVERILLQLRGMLDELRAVPAPGTAIQSCIGGSLRDSRIPRPEPRFGPFSTTHAFHEWLREGLGPEEKPRYVDDEEWTDIKYMIAMQNRDCESPVFTHGDLNPFNIIVRDGNIEAIIDWEFSGWLPPYWEYTSVWLGNKIRGAWQQMAAKFIDPMTFLSVLLAASALLLTHVYLKLRQRRFKQFAQLPQLPTSLVWGHLRLYSEFRSRGPKDRHPELVFKDMHDALGKPPLMFVDMWPASKPVVLLTSHELAEQMARSSSKFPFSPPKASPIKDLVHVTGEKSILTSEGPEWKRLRCEQRVRSAADVLLRRARFDRRAPLVDIL